MDPGIQPLTTQNLSSSPDMPDASAWILKWQTGARQALNSTTESEQIDNPWVSSPSKVKQQLIYPRHIYGAKPLSQFLKVKAVPEKPVIGNAWAWSTQHPDI